MFGFVNIRKPIEMTSHDVIAKLRRVTGIKQIGHAGTLDPFAGGVLPVAVGNATRLIEFLKDDKTYVATVQFGSNTNTYDIEGETTEIFNKKITEDELLTALKTFEGKQEQIPPIYSAIKIKGVKAYEYARKGEEVTLRPKEVYINKIELKSFDEKKQTAEILVDCSKGTYIRSIAYDLGKKLKCGAHLSRLIRTRAGDFKIENSVYLVDCTDLEVISKNLINPLDVLDMPKYEISYYKYLKVLQGRSFQSDKIVCDESFLLIYNNTIVAVAIMENGLVRVKKVFK